MTETYMPSYFDEVFEEKLIQTILVDHTFGEQIMEVFDSDYIGKSHTRKMGELLSDYYSEYETFPSVDLIPGILDNEVSDPIVLKSCKNYLKKIQKKPLNGDIDFVKEKSLEFFRLKHILYVVTNDVLPRIEQGVSKVDEIVSVIERAVHMGTDNNLGYDYMEDEEERFNEELIETIPTLWDAIDERTRGGGLGKKRLVTLLAPPGAGKSTLAVNIGKAALLQGKVVVYYTFELDWREIAEKFDASISGINITNVCQAKEIVLKSLRDKIPAGGRLIIKEYPIRGASVQTIRNHLTKLKLQGIYPDEIIIDQGGHLKPAQTNKETRHNLDSNWIDAKRLAQLENLPVIILHQINRAGYNEELITLDMVAECFAIIGHSDIVITLARNLSQKKAGLGKILLGKNRQGEDGVVLAYAINGAKALIEVMEMTDELEMLLEEQKENAQRSKDESLAAKIERFRQREKMKKEKEKDDDEEE